MLRDRVGPLAGVQIAPHQRSDLLSGPDGLRLRLLQIHLFAWLHIHKDHPMSVLRLQRHQCRRRMAAFRRLRLNYSTRDGFTSFIVRL